MEEEELEENNEENRKEIRTKIKSSATNLCTYVVNTCIEYKQELLKLEEDNKKLKRKNKNLKKQNKNLSEQNDILNDEFIESQNRINKLIEKFGITNVCYNCDHFLDCRDIYLCVYCKKWVCSCCIFFCREELGFEDNGEIKYCNISICKSCDKTHSKCPLHINLNKELTNELMEYYQNNKGKKF